VRKSRCRDRSCQEEVDARGHGVVPISPHHRRDGSRVRRTHADESRHGESRPHRLVKSRSAVVPEPKTTSSIDEAARTVETLRHLIQRVPSDAGDARVLHTQALQTRSERGPELQSRMKRQLSLQRGRSAVADATPARDDELEISELQRPSESHACVHIEDAAAKDETLHVRAAIQSEEERVEVGSRPHPTHAALGPSNLAHAGGRRHDVCGVSIQTLTTPHQMERIEASRRVASAEARHVETVMARLGTFDWDTGSRGEVGAIYGR